MARISPHPHFLELGCCLHSPFTVESLSVLLFRLSALQRQRQRPHQHQHQRAKNPRLSHCLSLLFVLQQS